jgi:Flp pilus assembly protein TadD
MKASRKASATALALVLSACIGLAGCAKDPRTTGSVSRGSSSLAQMNVGQLDQQVRKLSAAFEKKPKDKRIGLEYASVLRMTGRDDQALAVMRKMVIYYPTDNEILAAYGKALASAGQLDEALNAIQRAQKPETPDWKLLSAEGAILDQLGRQQEARDMYRKALDIAPNQPSILSNLGMSYLLANDLRAAETYLRKANSMPGADSRVRQNLALVVGLQGRFDEAEQIASAELPPDAAKENIDYLRKMLAQQNSWAALKQEDEPAKAQ